MIESIARKIHRHNRYVVNSIGKKELEHLLSVANVLHSENPLQIEDEWIKEYSLKEGDIDVTAIDKELTEIVPRATQMGKVYQRLIIDTLKPDENYADGILRVYNDKICDTIDNYNCSAFYEPSYTIAKAYYAGGF